MNSGSAYIFNRAADGTWSETAKLTASDGDSQDNFGTSVSISGDTAIVGALNHDDFSGSAYLFKRAADGTWSETINSLQQMAGG